MVAPQVEGHVYHKQIVLQVGVYISSSDLESELPDSVSVLISSYTVYSSSSASPSSSEDVASDVFKSRLMLLEDD